MSAPDLLPDCRARTPTQTLPGPYGYRVLVYCGSCGAPGALVPADGMTFAYYLCLDCASKWSLAADEMLIPDELYFAKLAAEQWATFGRYPTEQELQAVVEADSSPLATLLKEAPAIS